MLNALINDINQADGQYSEFSTELSDIADGLAEDASAEDLNSLIDRAVHATQAALEHSAEIKKKLSSLASEMQHYVAPAYWSESVTYSCMGSRSEPLPGISLR